MWRVGEIGCYLILNLLENFSTAYLRTIIKPKNPEYLVLKRWQISFIGHVLVVGPFPNLSDDFMVLCDFHGRARALKAINSWYI